MKSFSKPVRSNIKEFSNNQPLSDSVENFFDNQKFHPKSKNWWTHIWQGLVADKTAKHQKSMRQAVWLYLYFLTFANRNTGILYRKLSTIVSETGFSKRTVTRWLKVLRENEYVTTEPTGRALIISVTKWKPVTKRHNESFKKHPYD